MAVLKKSHRASQTWLSVAVGLPGEQSFEYYRSKVERCILVMDFEAGDIRVLSHKKYEMPSQWRHDRVFWFVELLTCKRCGLNLPAFGQGVAEVRSRICKRDGGRSSEFIHRSGYQEVFCHCNEDFA